MPSSDHNGEACGPLVVRDPFSSCDVKASRDENVEAQIGLGVGSSLFYWMTKAINAANNI